MAPPERGDLVLDPSQYVFIRDDKGSVRAYVGPQVKTIGANELPILFKDGKFGAAANQDAAIQDFVYVDQNSYVILNNPSGDAHKGHPEPGSASQTPELQYGRNEIITGPTRFALWPGQTTRIIKGHVLRSNEYLVALVKNGDEATANWSRAILKPQTASATITAMPEGGAPTDGEQQNAATLVAPPTTDAPTTEPARLSTGQRLVIRGTDYSFFIPPTGVEVLKDEDAKGQDGGYVRKAVTLESLQYCVLLSESGEKRYVHGPDVVFPEPDETFIKADGDGDNPRIFRAIELNEQMGIHVKVIADYSEKDGTPRSAGEEVFITGATQKLYYPRPEHAVIPYRDKEQIHYSVIVPEGEGRYVLDKKTGAIRTVRGPLMLLVNPISEVMMRRVLSEKEARLWFPGNAEVEQVNKELRDAQGPSEFLSERAVSPSNRVVRSNYAAMVSTDDSFGGDQVTRRKQFTLPKTITLKTKYDGAVNINVWPGYAVQTVARTGERKVIVGPASVLLDFDQTLAVFELSAGTPKGAAEKTRGVYLRVVGNKVSDKIGFDTSDLVTANAHVAYRVSFNGEQDAWFNIDDYVGFLTDHLRSVLRGAMKKVGIQEFMANHVEIIRDAILGVATVGGVRPGKHFEENSMHVYDAEVLGIAIADPQIGQLLIGAQKAAVQQALTLQENERTLALTQKSEAIKRQIIDEQATTFLATAEAEARKHEKTAEIEQAKQRALLLIDELANSVALKVLEREKAQSDQEIAVLSARAGVEREGIEATTTALVARFAAIQPDLVAVLDSVAKTDLMIKVAERLKTLPMGIDEGMADTLDRMFKGTMFAKVLAGDAKQI